MDEDKRVSSEAPDEPAKSNAEAENAAAQEASAADGGRDVEALAAENQALRAQAEELNDRNLRLVAEMENLRRRTERDKSEFAKYAISEFARDVLTVGDNLRRAIEALPKEAVVSDPAITSLIEGVEVTERELIKVLERFQVKRFDPLGEPFNPHLHEAMTKVEVPNVPADTVIQTVHAGYMIGDRVLRPAAVIVAKGGGAAEQTRGDGDGSIPRGAMRVPGDAVSSASARQSGSGGTEARGRASVPPEDRGHHGGAEPQASWAADERVAPFRRGRQGASFDRERQSNQSRSSSTLHKPVIGGGSKRDW
jgi:molecular chaperone GrpE